MTDALAERQRDISRSYDRIAAQITWLLGERDVDDRSVGTAVTTAMRGETFGAPFTASNRRNVILRLALLCLWRGPFLSPTFLVSGPLRLERVAAGDGKASDLVAAVRALEPSSLDGSELVSRVRATLGEPEELVTNLWSLEEPALHERLARIRERLASDEGIALLDAVADEVSRHAAEVVDAVPPPAQEYVVRGVARVDAGDLEGAALDAEAAIRELPRAPGGYWIRGRVAALRGDRSAALDAYETALAFDPNHAATYAARADVHTAAGDHHRALADLDKAVSLSDAGTLYFNRGTVKLTMRDLDGAEADFTAAIERDAKDAQAYMNRGTVRLMRGRTEAGLDDLRRAAEAAPDYAQARMKYGVVLYELRRLPEALVELRAALACAPPGWPPRAQIEGIVASIR